MCIYLKKGLEVRYNSVRNKGHLRKYLANVI